MARGFSRTVIELSQLGKVRPTQARYGSLNSAWDAPCFNWKGNGNVLLDNDTPTR
jgi:hypothetical protein